MSEPPFDEDDDLPFDPDAGDDPDTRPESAASALAAHDFDGLDLAAIIANQTRNAPLPAPKGIRKRPRSRPVAVDRNARSGPGPDPRDPQLLGDVVDRLMEERGWSTQVNTRMLLDRWRDLVGEVNALHTTVEGYDKGIVTVRADSSTWAASMRAIAPQLVAELNRRLGDGTVLRVQVLGPSAPSWKHGRRSVRDGRGPRDTYG